MKTDNFMINPRGGLIGSGHPLGATGISQTIEIVQQLQKTAGNRQTNNPKTGLVPQPCQLLQHPQRYWSWKNEF